VVLGRPKVAIHSVSRRKVEMERDQLGHSRRSADARAMDCRNLVDAGAQNWGGLEAAGHRGRLSTAPGGNRFPRLATTFCARRPGRCGIATIPISVGGGRNDLLAFGCGPEPVAQTVSLAVTHPQGFTVAATRGFSGGSAAAAAAPSAAPTAIHVWRAREPLGLQLLWRKPDLQPAWQFLLLLQLHSELLEEHPRVRG
jgi:hypothetical protein